MPPTIVLIAIVVLVAVALVHGYRLLTGLLALRSLPAAARDSPLPIVDGESVAVTGELVVDEPVATAEAAVENSDRAVGAYLWRTRFPDNTNSDLTIQDWGWEDQHWHTFASGIESGRFGIAADGRTIRVDPSWLHEASGGDTLGNLEIGGVTNSERLSNYLWDSWYVFLRNRTEHRSLRHFAGHVDRHNDDVNLDRYLLEARPLLDGTTVSVSGELRIEQGEPILRGTDERPLMVSDSGFDGHRRWLRRQALQNGAIAMGLVGVAVSLWFGFYIPLAVLIVGVLAYGAYQFVQDLGVVRRWLRR
jgi:hypothetical protein